MAAEAHRVKTIFGLVIDADPVERERILARECDGDPELRRRLDALLRAHDRPASALERPFEVAQPDPDQTIDLPPTTADLIADRYKRLQLIGEGGMGEVWVADQVEPVRRRVAIKLIKPGMDSRSVLGRFEAERQALAMMDHPNIAKVLDAGTTADGRPFFVMELVKGTPITEFCDTRKLSPRERLELFVPVCHAIQHAHLKGIIHRDIKPSNVLVALHDEKPVPKVIDFGIAKAVGQQLTEQTIYTGFGALVGTPAYMAPEQATFNQLDIDTRADVYALGVLLYELLAGSPPFELERLKKAALDEVLRLVREEEPPRPSARLSTSESRATIAATRRSEPNSLAQLMRGELDWIVMKALEKDRTRRYETATGLARDVERYLKDEPVEACPPTLGYRVRKTYRKHRAAALTASAFVLVILAGAGVAAWQAVRATNAEREAALERDRTAEQRDAAVVAQRDADQKREEAKVALETLRETQERQQDDQYIWDMQLVPLAFDANNSAEAHRLLDRHVPQAGQRDRRGFEWFYWDRQLHADISTAQLPGIGAARGLWSVSPDGARVALFVPPRPEDVPPNDAPLLTVWDVAERKVLITYRMPLTKPFQQTYMSSNPVRPVFSKDGSRVVIEWGFLGSNPPGVQQLRQIVEVKTGKVLLALEGVQGGTRFAQRHQLEGAFSPDGRRFAAVCLVPGKAGRPVRPGREIRVWEIESGKESCAPLDVDALADSPFSPDGTLLVVQKANGANTRVAVWDIDKNEVRTGWDVRDKNVAALVLSPDGKCVSAIIAPRASVKDATQNEPEQVMLWSVETGKELHAVTFQALPGNRVRYTPRLFFSPTGERLAVERYGLEVAGRPTSDFTILDTNSGEQLPVAATTETGIPTLRNAQGATFSHDGKYLLSLSGNTLQTWDVETGKPALTSRGHTGTIAARGFSPDGKRLWSVEDHGLLKEWEARPGGVVAIRFANARAEARESVAFAVSPDASHVASLLDVRTPGALTTSSAVQIWNSSGEPVAVLTPTTRAAVPKGFGQTNGPFNELALSGNGRRVVLTRADPRPEFGKESAAAPPDITVWDVESKAVLLYEKLDGSQIPFATIAPDGKTVAVAVVPRPETGTVTVRLLDPDGKRQLPPLTVEATGIFGLSFSPDGRKLAGLSVRYEAQRGKSSNTLVVWDVDGGSQLCRLSSEADGPVSMAVLGPRFAWAPDGSQFVFAHGRREEARIAVYDASSGQIRLTLDQPLAAEPNAFQYPHLAFSPNGKRIAAFLTSWSLGSPPALKVWDTSNGKELLAVRPTTSGHVNGPYRLTFADDAHRLLLAEFVSDMPKPGAANSSGRAIFLTTFDATPVQSREAQQP